MGDPSLAAIVSVAMLTPVFVWNGQHGLASFIFHLSDRHGGGYWMSDPDFSKLWEFPLASLILVSPFIFIAMFRFFLARLEPGFERTARWLAACAAWSAAPTGRSPACCRSLACNPT